MTPAAPDRLAFPHTWKANILPRAPLIAPARQFTFPQQVPGEEDALQRGALLLEVRPPTGGTFLATCALGFHDPALPSGVWSLPAPDDLLAVAGGYAYRIPSAQPGRTALLEQRPVTAVLPAIEQGLVLLAGFNDVLAVGPDGVPWRTARLSWEGVTLHEVRRGVLHGMGWDMFTDQERAFAVDLATGAHTGGGYQRRE